MSLHNLNTPNKQWLMYLNTLSSISGDDLTIKPDTRRNLLLEVSGNNNIFIKKGDISYNLTNLITSSTDASFSNVDVSVNLNPVILTGNFIQVGYDFSWQLMGSEINGEASGDRSGTSVSLNNDGNIVAIGAPGNDGNGSNSGHTRVYKYNSYDASWIRLGQDIDGDGSSVESGWAVSLNSSGNNVAILSNASTSIYKYNDISWVLMGAPITSDLGNWAVSLNSIGDIVAVGNTYAEFYKGDIRVYKFNNVNWAPLGQTLIGEGSYPLFGSSISLNAAGNIVAAGTEPLSSEAGYVKIYSYNGVSWVPMGQKLVEEAPNDKFGFSVSLNDEGNIIAIGAPNNDGNGTDTGHVRVYKYDTIDLLWKPLGQDIDGLASQLGFGRSVSLNSIGNIVAIGGSFKPHGYTKVYYYNDITWEPIGVTISGEATGDTANTYTYDLYTYSGHSVSLNSTGNIVAIGAPQNDGNGYINDGYGGNSFDIGSVRIYNLTSKTNSNNSNIGLPSKVWGNAYIRDISVTNMSVSGNMTISGTISNVIQIIPRLANDISSSLGSTTNIWQRAFIRDLSNINSINGITWSAAGLTGPAGPQGPAGPTGTVRIGPIGPAGTTITGTWRDISNLTLTTYHRIYQNMYPKYELNTTIQSWALHRANAVSLGKTLATILNATQNQQVINLLVANNISRAFIGGLRTSNSSATGKTSADWQWVNGDIWSYTNFMPGQPDLPQETSLEYYTASLGSIPHQWNDIANINSVAVYMSYEDLSWNTPNGYYGLAKDAYPSLNLYSSGVLATRTWTYREEILGSQGMNNDHNVWQSVCWSPQLRLFVAVGGNADTIIMTSNNGINWIGRTAPEANQYWDGVCWSPELRRFVAVGYGGNNRAMTSPDGIVWTGRGGVALDNKDWASVCWSPELGIFVAVSYGGHVSTSSNGSNWIEQTVPVGNEWSSICWSPELGLFVVIARGGDNNRIMISNNGINWTAIVAPQSNYWRSICWSPQIGIFVAVSYDGINRLMTSSDGINWNLRIVSRDNEWASVCWSAELGIFIALANYGPNRVMISPDGINWTLIANATDYGWLSICWSSELGIAVGTGMFNAVMTSSLKGRPPTSYNVFDSSFNSIDENGKWDFLNINVTTLTVNEATVNSDDRLKHNEVAITNGLDVIDRLTPKFYQKTQVLLDASYNGDLSSYAWNYEAGLIAQEVLQINDLSFVVSGGDYYEKKYKLIKQTRQNNNLSANYYDLSANNYEVINNLITQAYNLNYNSVFVYGLAAIKELHTKVKAQESTILNQKNIISSLLARIQALEK